jgi:hypothetical protein
MHLDSHMSNLDLIVLAARQRAGFSAIHIELPDLYIQLIERIVNAADVGR